MQSIDTLKSILAANYMLYVKTQNFHWNVKGPTFMMLHEMFEHQYENLAEANDELAERIRALGTLAPGMMSEFLKLSFISESANDLPHEMMVKTLAQDHGLMVQKLLEAIKQFEDEGDVGTADMLTARLQYHREKAWMLNSTVAA